MNISARAIIFTNFAGIVFNSVGDSYRMYDLSFCYRKRKSFCFLFVILVSIARDGGMKAGWGGL